MKVVDLVFQHLETEVNRVKTIPNVRFAHYTSAATVKSIFDNKAIWMRNTSVMNDFAEIRHGADSVQRFFNFKTGQARSFWQVLEQKFPGISKDIDSDYSSWANDLKWKTYVTSLSIHQQKEDSNGRLSMWRAYGQNNGVALVLKPEIFFTESDAFNAFSYPALYWDDEKIDNEFTDVVSRFEQHVPNFTDEQRGDLIYWIKEMFHSFAISLKHPGFAEEQEWRIVYRPNDRISKIIKQSVESISGVPQIIHQIPLVEEYDTSIAQMLDSIIIGPSEHAWETKEAFTELLATAGVKNPREKIIVSGIPLRNS